MRFKQFFKTTQARIFVLLFCFSMVIVFFMYLLFTLFYEKEFSEHKKQFYTEQTYNLSYIFSTNVEKSLANERNKSVYDDVSTKFSMSMELLNKDLDHVIYTNHKKDTLGKNAFSVDAPIVKNGQLLGYLRVYYDLDDRVVSPSLTTLQKHLKEKGLLIVQITFGLLVIASFLLARLLSKPAKQVSAASLQVLQGNRDTSIPKKGSIEMSQLIDTVNGLLIEFDNMESWRKQMLQDLAHELRTPITSVLTTIEAMIDGVYPATTENMEDIYGEVERLSRLIINVQSLSEAESAQFKLNIRKVDIVQLIKGVYEGFQFIARQEDIQLHFNYPNRPFKAEVDPDRYTQVITNIISNALKYTEAGGTVQIGLEDNKENLVFYCVDNGIGIAETNQSLVFNRFYRTDQSRSSDNGGSGIGLNISLALVQAHGGKIDVESKLGEGSIFWVTIPVHNSTST